MKKNPLKLTKKFPLELPLEFHARMVKLADKEGEPLYLWILKHLERIVEEKEKQIAEVENKY